MTNHSDRSRRSFLKSVALAAPIMLGEAIARPQTKESPHSADSSSAGWASSRNYLGKNTRLSISMWDFSWLVAKYPGGAYEDLERRVAEAAERGYNTLRVDCFPSRILERESTFPRRNWKPGVNLPMWGESAADHTCNVRKEVARLADLCRKHGIWLGLDSWDKAHMFWSAKLPFVETSGAPSILFGLPYSTRIPQGREEQAFTAYGEIWVQALKLMREDGVLERAVWIAPMNEVPHFCGRSVAAVDAIEHNPRNEGETKLETTAEVDAIYSRLNDYMGAAIKSEVAKEQIPLSYSSLGAENYAARLTDTYDVVDIHFMPGVITDAEDMRAFQKAGPGAPGGSFQDYEKFDLKAFSAAWDNACCRHYPAMLERASSYFTTALQHTTLPSGKRLQAIITEPYGPLIWPDSPDVSWEWYKRYNADALRIVAAMNFTGASLSNYGEPLFTLWDDAGWHWAGNNFFRTTPQLIAE
jgi:Sugar-binding cellulase-like